MKDLYEKNKSKVTLIIIIVICLFFIWLLFIGPLIKFKKNEKILLEAGKRYYEVDSTKLPTGSRIDLVSLQKLYDKDFISIDLRTSYTSKLCDSNKSWVKVRKENGEYKYYIYLKCGVFESKGVDNEGLKITLKGSQTLTIERGEKYDEPGVSTVIDNVDGNIDIKNVKIDSSKVNTNKNGTYEVTYKVVDSFRNETIVTRKIIVNQTLNNIVSKDTQNKNYYVGNANNNYIKIDGIIFKIVKINDDETVKVVTADPISYVDYNSVDKWLNEYFYSKLSDNAKKYIVENSKWCVDKVSNPETVTECKKYGAKKTVGLLSVDEINQINKTDDKFNNIVGTSWTFGTNSNKAISYDYANSKYKEMSKESILQVYPALNLEKNIEIVAGNGSETSPYRYSGNKIRGAGTKVNELKTGEYISYSGYSWRVIGKNESGSTKLIMEGLLQDEDGEFVGDYYGSKIYNPSKKDSIGYKILNDYSKYINTKRMVKEKVDVIDYSSKVSYNSNKIHGSYNIKMFLPSIFDLYSVPKNVSDYNWFIETFGDKIYYKSTDNNLGYYKVDDGKSAFISLVINIDKSSSIVSGNGTIYNPYKIS